MAPKLKHTKLTLPDGTKHAFAFRGHSEGDKGVLEQVFAQQDYNLSPFKMTERLFGYAKATQGTRQKLIVDAGANIGASPLYFASRYPDSTVIAIEPERHNFTLLTQNCAGRAITCMEGAVGSTAGEMFLSDPGLSDWGFRVGEKGDYAVPVFTLDRLLTDYPATDYLPFICKIDIEGGEANLFSQHTQWMDAFPLIIIELHDWMLPGQGNARNFFKALLQFNFDFVFRGENAFCFNNKLLVG